MKKIIKAIWKDDYKSCGNPLSRADLLAQEERVYHKGALNAAWKDHVNQGERTEPVGEMLDMIIAEPELFTEHFKQCLIAACYKVCFRS